MKLDLSRRDISLHGYLAQVNRPSFLIKREERTA